MSLTIQRLCTIFALALFFGSPAHAIVNVSGPRKGDLGSIRLCYTSSIKTGNTDIIDVGLSGAQYTEVNFSDVSRASATMAKNRTKYLYNTFEHLRIRQVGDIIT